jgi:hypothetical protein
MDGNQNVEHRTPNIERRPGSADFQVRSGGVREFATLKWHANRLPASFPKTADES